MNLRNAVTDRPGLREAVYWVATLARDARELISSRLRPAPPSPSFISIEPSNLCNANCVFCGYQHQERPHQAVDMELAYRVIDRSREIGIRQMGLTPIVGEPLVNRDLEDLIRYARRPPTPLEVGVTTNGLLLSAKRYLSLVDAGVSQIAISMTYPDADEYARVYRNPSFRTLMRNLEEVLDVYRPEHCAITFGVRSGRKGNWDHPLFDRARAAGWHVERNVFMDDWSGTVTDAVREQGLALRPMRAKRLPCTMLYTGPHFLSDGRPTACGCRDLDGKSELVLDGEALLANFREDYATGQVARLRERFRTQQLPDVCVSCRHYSPQFAGEPFRDGVVQLVADGAAALRRATTKAAPRRHLNVVSS